MCVYFWMKNLIYRCVSLWNRTTIPRKWEIHNWEHDHFVQETCVFCENSPSLRSKWSYSAEFSNENVCAWHESLTCEVYRWSGKGIVWFFQHRFSLAHAGEIQVSSALLSNCPWNSGLQKCVGYSGKQMMWQQLCLTPMPPGALNKDVAGMSWSQSQICLKSTTPIYGEKHEKIFPSGVNSEESSAEPCWRPAPNNIACMFCTTTSNPWFPRGDR